MGLRNYSACSGVQPAPGCGAARSGVTPWSAAIWCRVARRAAAFRPGWARSGPALLGAQSPPWHEPWDVAGGVLLVAWLWSENFLLVGERAQGCSRRMPAHAGLAERPLMCHPEHEGPPLRVLGGIPSGGRDTGAGGGYAVLVCPPPLCARASLPALQSTSCFARGCCLVARCPAECPGWSGQHRGARASGRAVPMPLAVP